MRVQTRARIMRPSAGGREAHACARCALVGALRIAPIGAQKRPLAAQPLPRKNQTKSSQTRKNAKKLSANGNLLPSALLRRPSGCAVRPERRDFRRLCGWNGAWLCRQQSCLCRPFLGYALLFSEILAFAYLPYRGRGSAQISEVVKGKAIRNSGI